MIITDSELPADSAAAGGSETRLRLAADSESEWRCLGHDSDGPRADSQAASEHASEQGSAGCPLSERPVPPRETGPGRWDGQWDRYRESVTRLVTPGAQTQRARLSHG